MKILFLGAGNMAEAIIRGLLASRKMNNKNICATDVRRERLTFLQKKYKINISSCNIHSLSATDTIVLAVKPQQIKDLLTEICCYVKKQQLIVSIAAGIPTKFIEKVLCQKVPVVRVMPNTPALVGAGMTVVSRGKYAKVKHEQFVKDIFSAVGKTVCLPEKYMDTVTAVSGSGPAYVFFLAELMAKAGNEMGLPEKVVLQLVKQTVFGAAKLMIESDDLPETLRARVTSPGGTTQAAITYMQDKKFDKILIEALNKAKNRASELAGRR